MTDASYAAEFIDVAKTYRPQRPWGQGLPALRGVSLRVPTGEALALLGPNRAGKSTLLKILLGLCRTGRGQVLRLDRPVTERGTLARVGFMHENQAFPRYLTARALLDFYGRLAGIPARTVATRARALLERVGLADRAGEPIARFSKGMVQRLALAQAILGEPELLVLDEPVEGLDLDARVLLREVVAEQRAAGRTVLLVSHALEEVERHCDSLAVLVEGQLVHHGPVAALLRDPATGAARPLETALRSYYRM